ncbi:MAG: putative toxin-antitoxin system toxin component, PIN family [Desulfurococcales archaeon]|nr:putative toxin-antitoxin system toxin component, PIN family [Desulfurococcales archaeon]
MARGGGEEEAKERTTRKPAIVLDTNIIISSLIKPGGFTRRVILLLEDQADLYAPKALLEELTKKTEYLARKKRVSPAEQRHLLTLLLSSVRTIESDAIKPLIKAAMEYVRDPDDAPFVALAIYLQRVYEDVIILTWNTSDYKREDLEMLKIKVFTPREVLAL